MRQWRCVYSVNGTKTEEIVSAFTSFDAKKLVEARYPGSKIIWWRCEQIH